jgi:isochorismate synthase
MSDTKLYTAGPADNKAFVLFRLPGKAESVCFWGKASSTDLENISDKTGFLLAPYQATSGNPAIFLEPEASINSTESDFEPCVKQLFLSSIISQKNLTDPISKDEYLFRLKTLIDDIKTGKAEKVVFSRTLASIPLSGIQIFEVYKKLCVLQPDAFVYVAHLPPYGTWMAATPEILVWSKVPQCSTVSLAGTRASGTNDEWGKKELEEQAIVTRYIHKILKKHPVKNLEIHGPQTKNAGRVEHLCTYFNFEIKPDSVLTLAASLHPTPAVCGMPPEPAMSLIEKYENYNRGYYTGFCGPLNYQEQTALFVNLRCMEINASGSVLYAGGGITSSSIPEKEWNETEIKADTLLRAIEEILSSQLP